MRASLQFARLQTVQTLQTLPQAWRRQPSQTREARPQTVPRAQVSQVVEARFFFLFTGSESNVRHGRSRPQTLQTLPQAQLLYSSFLVGSEGDVRYGRSRPQTLQTLPHAQLLVFLSVQKVTLGTGGPALKPYKRSRRPGYYFSSNPYKPYKRFCRLFDGNLSNLSHCF